MRHNNEHLARCLGMPHATHVCVREPLPSVSCLNVMLLLLLLLQRRAMLGLPEGDTDPLLDTLASDQADSDGSGSGADGNDKEEDLECLREPPELQAARAALAAYSARPGEEEPSGDDLESLGNFPVPMTGKSLSSSDTTTERTACSLLPSKAGHKLRVSKNIQLKELNATSCSSNCRKAAINVLAAAWVCVVPCRAVQGSTATGAAGQGHQTSQLVGSR